MWRLLSYSEVLQVLMLLHSVHVALILRTVRVIWTQTWADPVKEREAAKTLIRAGRRCIDQCRYDCGLRKQLKSKGYV